MPCVALSAGEHPPSTGSAVTAGAGSDIGTTSETGARPPDCGERIRLSQLILKEKESILRDFEEFARTHTPPGKSMDVDALRDHADGMLEAIARDLERPQKPFA